LGAAVDCVQEAAYSGGDAARLAMFGHSLGGWAATVATAADSRLKAVIACASVTGLGGLKLMPADQMPGLLTPDQGRIYTPAEHILHASFTS